MNFNVKTAVLIIEFKRKNTLEQVFNSVKLVNPKRIYIALDGSRINNEDDAAKNRDVRNLCDSIDWCADVRKKFRTENAGCKKNVEQAISWAFETEERLIIPEDDTVPSVSFYKFCDEMLQMHEDNTSVYNICGYSPVDVTDEETPDLFFSKVVGISGRATWKRAWEKYDSKMDGFEKNDFRNKMLKAYKNRRHALYRYYLFYSQYKMKKQHETGS